MNNKFEQELLEIKLKMKSTTTADHNFIGTFVHDLLSEIAFIVFKKDDDGNVIYTDKGIPKVDWTKVLLNIGKIVGKIVGIMMATKNASLKK